MISIAQVFENNHEKLKLSWIHCQENGYRELDSEYAASSDLVGHLNLIHPNRIQVLGYQEIDYYHRLQKANPERLGEEVRELCSGNPPAVIIAEGLTAPFYLSQACLKNHLPLLQSPYPAATVIDMLRVYLSKELAEKAYFHGVYMDVFGLGVLISGESGLGKSELGLELISRGHGLVADDSVEFCRTAPNYVEGRCPPLLQNLLEVRGIGLLDIKSIFGETAVRRKMRLRLITHLVRQKHLTEYDRLPFDAQTQDVLGLPIRKVIIPVDAGRNLAVLLEAAVRNTILQMRGIDTLKEFMQRQQIMMQEDL
jgi:HPr kinase/phosphorylase